MEAAPRCPICFNEEWERSGKKTYRKYETSHLSEPAKVRYEVLFQIWLKEVDEAEFQSAVCEACGFVCFHPRPTEHDLDNKYRFLNSHPIAKKEGGTARESDKHKSAALYNYISGFLTKRQARVLDFGGGNGRLMGSLVENGHLCYVIDYVEECLPGIEKLGDTLDDLPVDRKFDLIVCSHVLEHLAEPRKIVEKLSKHLEPKGVLYAEVPLEIWNTLPLPEEPVTHINFFTAQSMDALLKLSGMEVLSCEESMFTTHDGSNQFAIKAIAGLSSESKTDWDFSENAEAARQLMMPTFMGKLSRFMAFPAYRRQIYKNWARRNIPYFWRYF